MYQTIASGLKVVQDEQSLRAAKVKDLVLTAENVTKENQEAVKELQAKHAAGQATGVQVMQREFKVLQRHKQLVKDFVYAEMRAHAKQLEQYARLFEEVQQRVRVEQEFLETMNQEGRFPQSEVTEFIQMKMKGTLAAEMGNQFRAGGSA